MIRLASLLLLAGCTLEISVGMTGPEGDGRTQVALIPMTNTSDVDVLFVLDDSPAGGQYLQRSLQQAFPTFLQTLEGPSGLPNLHIGVISTDLGTIGAHDAAPGPGIGSGPGSCSGIGKAGELQSSSVITGANFIADVDTGSTRETNYTGTLVDAFTSTSALGSAGCGFEQPLQAAVRGLGANASNVGFLRPNARLAVIVVTNEDDCSMAHSTLMGIDTTTLGPLQSFRCTRFGVTCDEGGATTDEMNEIGPKARCHSNDSSPYTTSVATTVDAIKATKSDPRNILFATIAGVAASIEVELAVPPGGGSPIPALGSACEYQATDVVIGEPVLLEVDPAVRLTEAAARFDRRYVQMPCGEDLSAPAYGIAREIRGMLGDACVTRPIATPTDCVAFDVRANGTKTSLPACSGGTSECFRFVQDATCGPPGLRVEVLRTTPPPTDTMVQLRCRI